MYSQMSQSNVILHSSHRFFSHSVKITLTEIDIVDISQEFPQFSALKFQTSFILFRIIIREDDSQAMKMSNI